MIIPGHLHGMGFLDIPLLAEINRRSYVELEDQVLDVEPWASLRDVFEYYACMEYSVSRIDLVPQGKALNGSYLTPVRYDSAALVFFAQATLDVLAGWLNKTFKLALENTDISFYNKGMAKKLSEIDQAFGTVLAEDKAFIQRLNKYRMHWVHKQSGGAILFFNAHPDHPDFFPEILVPLEPNILKMAKDTGAYLDAIERIKAQNDGEWVIPVGEFAHDIKENVLKLILDLLDIASRRII